MCPFNSTAFAVSGKDFKVGIPLTGLITPAGWLTLFQLTVLSRYAIVVLSKLLVAFCVVTLLFGFFCWCRCFCHRTESDIHNESVYTNRKFNNKVYNTKTPPKTLITQRWQTDLGRSVGVTAIQLVWLNRYTGTQSSHLPQRSCNQKDSQSANVTFLISCFEHWLVVFIWHYHIYQANKWSCLQLDSKRIRFLNKRSCLQLDS